MSLSSRIWARDVVIPPGDPANGRFVPSMLRHLLKELADFDQGTGEVYGFVATLVRYTDMDRKTVLAYLQELVRRGLLRDTGKRAGRTKQTPIYELVGFKSDFSRVGPADAKSPAEGTLSKMAQSAAAGSAQDSDSTGDFDDREGADHSSGERVPPAVPFENQRVPPRDGKSPAEESKESRRRDTNSSLNLTEQEARAHAPKGARARAPEPEQQRPTAEQILQRWRNRLAPIAAGEVDLLLHGKGISVSRNFPTWPAELQRIFFAEISAVSESAANLEIARGYCSPAMKVEADEAAQRAASEIASRYAVMRSPVAA